MNMTQSFLQQENAALFFTAWEILATQIHEMAVEKGWWADEEVLDEEIEVAHHQRMVRVELLLKNVREKLVNLTTFAKIALVGTEISEALEGVRGKNGQPLMSDKIPEFTAVEEECADAVIRIMDLGKRRKLRIVQAILAKVAYNATRSFKHGGKTV